MMMVMIPKLTLTGGTARRTATCEENCSFIEFEVDWLAGEDVDFCTVCELAIETGWLCLDGGNVYCHEQVEVIKDAENQ